jgi:uncharacterized protein YndB with AHSA1/START domain/DNA-binding transcriptional ArsR family regulator
MNAVFKALADPSRRELLDRLNARNGQSLSELCDGLRMARQSVTKHLAVLEAANLITTTRRGREKLHFLNTAPINEIADRWINRYHRQRVRALADLKRVLEDDPMSETEFVYSTYIKTTPEKLWAALTEPAVMLRYWGVALYSDWEVGSVVRWRSDGSKETGRAIASEPDDDDTLVLESIPYRRLSYTWHNYQPEHAELFGWDAAYLAELRTQPLSKVTFEIEPCGPAVKLTVIHHGFEPGSEMLEACSGRKPQSGGWPELLADLKSLLETGDTMHIRDAVTSS